MNMKQPTRLDTYQLDRGKWLYDLLSDVRQDITQQPSDDAIRRIRAQLEQGMEAEAGKVAVAA